MERIFVNFFVAVALVGELIVDVGGSEATLAVRVVPAGVVGDFSSGIINLGAADEDDDEAIGLCVILEKDRQTNRSGSIFNRRKEKKRKYYRSSSSGSRSPSKRNRINRR